MKAGLHKDGSADWSLSERTLALLTAHVRPGLRTLETGAGYSTLLFAATGCQHIVITPDDGEIQRIKAMAEDSQTSLELVTFIAKPSQDALPHILGRLDLVLVDGGHGFPIPQIDWYYAAALLEPGGILVLDDVQLWSVRTIHDFLKQDPAWTHLQTIEGKTAFFRLEVPFAYQEWCFQPYTVRHSRISTLLNYGRRAVGHIRERRFARLMKAIARKFGLSHASRGRSS